MHPRDPDHQPEEAPDTLAPTTVPLDEPEDPVTLELIQLVDEVIALKRAREPTEGEY